MLGTSPHFGAPLLIKHTFLQFELYPPSRPRSASAPPRLQRAVRTAALRNRKKRRAPCDVDDDDALLREARQHVLRETWQRLGAGVVEKTMGDAAKEVDAKRMKLRAALTSNAFGELLETMKDAELQLYVLAAMGVVRGGGSDGVHIEIYCSDEQLREEEFVATFVANARTVQIMHTNFIFLILPGLEAPLAVRYDKRMKISSLKRKARQFLDLPPSQPVRIEYLSGVELVANTVKDAGLAAGDSVCVRWH